MLIEKLAGGVVRVQTAIGPRYVKLTFPQRAYLLWMFRNFPILPHAVLSRRQQRMIDRLCAAQSFASVVYTEGIDEAPVIGTIERRPAMATASDSLPPRLPVASDRSSGLPAEVQQRP